MSTPSPRSRRSPPQRWLSNDDKPDAPKNSGEHIASSHALPSEPSPAPTASGGVEDTASPMSYPVDENLFYSAPSQPLATTGDLHEVGETDYREGVAEDSVHPPDFKPFFTLIEDPETGEHHHPTVHYIFSDDDPEILTNAALEALDGHRKGDKAEERYVIVDMAADGKTVASVSSLSREWQALQTSVAQAPSWGDDSKSEDRGLRLKISGQESKRRDVTKEKRRSLQNADNIENLLATFSEKLDGLDEVLGRTRDDHLEQRDLE